VAKLSQFACLTYHVLGEGSNPYGVSENQLRAHLAVLEGESYVVEGFEQLESRLRAGQGIPSRYVIFTIDDGQESSMRFAGLLEERGFRATFFVTRDRCLTRPRFIREPDIRSLRSRGFSLGAHGTTHQKLTFLSRDDCARELGESRRWLEDVIGEEVRYMALPGGYINSRVEQLAYEYGYALVGTCNEWMNTSPAMALPCTVNRVNVKRPFALPTFRRILVGHTGFYAWRQIRAAALWAPKQFLR
jgi:peptidoglycan/xylan/chitin deacetylase (PgdA/CDA1 family)